MINRIVASRYARALFDAALGMEAMKAVVEEFPKVIGIINGEKDFRDFLYHPTVGAEDKKRVMESVFKEKISSVLFDFLLLLIEKKREIYLPYVWEKYRQFVMEHEGRAEAQVFTPFPLTDDMRDKIKRVLARVTGKQITMQEVEAPQLIGGVRVKVGDLVIDGSLSNALNQARDHLLSIKVH